MYKRGTYVMAGLLFFICSCGGTSSNVIIPSPSSPTTTTPPSSGEYLVQLSSDLNVSTVNTSTGSLSVPQSLRVAGWITHGMGVTPSGRFLYGFTSGTAGIVGFEIVGPGFQLKPIYLASPDSELSLPNEFPESITFHPSGRYLYVIGSGAGPGTIHQFTIFTDSGMLKSSSVLTIGDYPDIRYGVTDPAGKFLFVTELSDDRLFVFQINQSDGSLAQVSGSPYIVDPNGTDPNSRSFVQSEAIESTGRFLYVTVCKQFSQCTLYGYSVDPIAGTLTTLPGSPYFPNASAGSVSITPSGKFLYTAGSTPDGWEIDCFQIDQSTGELRSTSKYTFAATSGGFHSPVVDPSGLYLFDYHVDASVPPPNNAAYYGLKIDATDGSLIPLSGSPFSAASTSGDVLESSFVSIP